MHRLVQGLLVAVAIVACASGVRAQDYDAVVVFGDSLSDSGNVVEALPLGLPAGSSFTTNPDPIWAEIVAETYGAPGGPSLAEGTNFAFGGTCVNRDIPCHVTVPVLGRIEMPRIDQQIDEHLLTRAQGEADPNHLYAIWAGSNDLVAVLEAVAAGEPVNPQTAIPATAQRYVGEIQRLQQAGARHIVVLNLPDVGQTPFAQSIPDPSFPPTLTALASAYNQALNVGLGTLDDGMYPSIPSACSTRFCRPRRGTASPVSPGRPARRSAGKLILSFVPRRARARLSPTNPAPTEATCSRTTNTQAAGRTRSLQMW